MFSLLGDMISFPADLGQQARKQNTHCFKGVLELVLVGIRCFVLGYNHTWFLQGHITGSMHVCLQLKFELWFRR